MNDCLTTPQQKSIGYWVNKIQNLLKLLKLIHGGIEKIAPHHIYQIFHFLSKRDDCTHYLWCQQGWVPNIIGHDNAIYKFSIEISSVK